MYRNFLSENHYVKYVDEGGKDYRKKRKKEVGIQVYKDWWSGMSDMSQKLFLEEILEKDVGFNGLPPSFVAGELACKRRREKINAAKQRIDEIMQPPNSVPGDKKNMAMPSPLGTCKITPITCNSVAFIELKYGALQNEWEPRWSLKTTMYHALSAVKEQSVLRQKSSLLDVPAYTTEVFSGYMWDYCVLCRVYAGFECVLRKKMLDETRESSLVLSSPAV
ncbi:hypothetical protein IFM89_034097 [Coptis chinensis]|uniref:Uncharacterized protein n=1 Tax=Coptis chinensis TaxID=261450 RepID=A0A835H250_9MAGN|nr:hypothetical protein IFM89_034097 [Coptis chinensis]